MQKAWVPRDLPFYTWVLWRCELFVRHAERFVEFHRGIDVPHGQDDVVESFD